MPGDSFLRSRPGTGPAGRVIGRLSLWLAFGAAFVLASMMYVTVIDVIGRYFFNRPLIGSVEIVFCLMGMMVFLGMGLTTFEDGHIRVDVLTRILPPRARAVLDSLVHVLAIGIAGLMSWRLLLVALDQTAEMNTTQVLGLPVWAVALAMAVCSTLLVVGLVYHFGRSVGSLSAGDSGGSAGENGRDTAGGGSGEAGAGDADSR